MTAPLVEDPRVTALLDGLNPQQRQAVVHEGPPLLIVAGAGSGKTRVLTHRIAYLLGGARCPTRRDPRDHVHEQGRRRDARARQRLGREPGAGDVGLDVPLGVRTDPARAAQAARLHVDVLDLRPGRQPARSSRSSPATSDLDVKRFPARRLANQISDLKNELIDYETAADKAENDIQRKVAEVYSSYQARLRQANAMDFDDLIMTTVNLLQAFPDIAEHYRRRFRHILVDEYQDTNHAQYMLVRELVGPATDALPPGELAVVGDADQSIYAFRGATIRNIDEFERDYPDATVVLLEQNYRSTQTILSAANGVIARNLGRKAEEPVVGRRTGREDRRVRRRLRARRGGSSSPPRSTTSPTTTT